MTKNVDERKALLRTLTAMEQELKELQIRYEQYFAGIEKREPYQDREDLARRIRVVTSRHIVQTDLRFRRQNIATRFHSYAGNWDRILRLMDEGKYHRQPGAKTVSSPPATKSGANNPAALSEADRLFNQLVAAHHASGRTGPPPQREQVAVAIERQRSKIKEKFGEREVEFNVVIEEGKPRIKVRPKN
ncbi:MAG: hypothetical protein K0A93_00275 [Desulfuromonadaceae bacterium]|nr:hypothetical protein [Desulfuromonadaceae bacterium]